MTSTQVELDNIGRVRKGFEAFAASDLATLSDLFAPDAVWRGEPVGILTGSYDNRDSIFAMFAQIGQETAGTFRSAPATMAASGDKVFVETTATGDRRGRKLDASQLLVFTLADGRVREVCAYQGDHAQSEAFWA